MTGTTILMFALLAGLTVGPASAIWCFVRRSVYGLMRRDVAGHHPVLPMGQNFSTETPAAVVSGSPSPPSRRPFVF